eukprot:4817803-Prymnesium_polylepis.1
MYHHPLLADAWRPPARPWAPRCVMRGGLRMTPAPSQPLHHAILVSRCLEECNFSRRLNHVCVCHALYTTRRRCAVNSHPPSSRPGSLHMRRQRSAGRDSRHYHGLGGDTWGRLTPPQHPRAGSGGHAATAW